MNLVGTLTAKTAKGKQRIKQWGNQGKIMRTVDSIQASPIKGLWFAVSAGDPTWRWVHFTDDKDFNIEVKPWKGSQFANTHATEDK